MRLAVTAALLGALPSLATADGMASSETVEACVTAQVEAGAPVADCVNEVQAACLEYPADAALAATACFLDAKEAWGSYIAARMETVRQSAPAEISAVAEIEVRYDLLQNLMQCDRMQELVLLRQEPSDATQLQKARCEATATGLAFVKMLLQSREFQ